MPTTLSDAAAAAAAAVTRSGRVKQPSSAALRSVASEDHEAQQARRSGANNKSVRRANANRQGQVIVSGTPKVLITGSTKPPATRKSGLAAITKAQRLKDSRSTFSPQLAAGSQNPTSANNSATAISARTPDSLELFYTTAGAQPRSRTATSVPASIATVANARNDTMDSEPIGVDGELLDDDNQLRDDEEAEEDVDPDGGRGVGFGAGNAEDWDDGASDEYVPSDVENTGGSDGLEEVERDDGGAEGGEDGQEEDGLPKKKSRAPRNSKTRSKKTQPKASDYNEDVEALLNHGLGIMRALVISEKPMPSVDESIEMATDAFEMAKLERPMVQPPSDVKHISILRRAIAQVRGRIKDAARARTGDTYGFDDRPRMEQKNRRRYLALVDQDAYTYEKPELLQGPYYHPLCYKILKTCFFGKATDDGVAFSDYFSPVRPETIALVFTAIRMCLDEWKSGSLKPLAFTSDVYEPVYKVHVANLKALEAEDPLFITGLGEELWEDCSEPFNLETKSKPTISIAAAQTASGALYAQERRNARAAQKAAAAAATAEVQMEL